MSVFGIDHAWGQPSVAALNKAGVKFVVRYLSHDTTGKNLTAAEAIRLSDAGIWVAVIWESTASRTLAGRSAGVADATEAAKQAAACGMPVDRPIYFAVDFDAQAGQQAAIHAYLDGAANVLGRARVGLYAGYGPIKRAFDAKKITFGWQTYAWSKGQWDDRAQLQQYSNGHSVGGVDSDYNRAMTDDYGQWKVGETPMALSADDLDKIRKIVWESDKAPAPAGSAASNPTWQYVSLLKDTNERTRVAVAGIAQLAKQTLGVDEAAIVAGVLAGLSPAAIASAVVTALPADLAAQVVDEITSRLST